jgi:hypothetical protein
MFLPGLEAKTRPYFAWRRSAGAHEQTRSLPDGPLRLDPWPLGIGDEWIGPA